MLYRCIPSQKAMTLSYVQQLTNVILSFDSEIAILLSFKLILYHKVKLVGKIEY